MDGGDDWTAEERKNKGNAWMPLIAVFVAIGSFFIALVAIVFGSQLMDIWNLMQVINPSDDQRAVLRAESAAHRVRRDASAAAREFKQHNRERNEADVKELETAMLEAGHGDFDRAKRDEIGRQIIELTPPKRRSALITVFRHAGALDLLLELGPSNRGGWYEVAIMREDWDRIAALDVEEDDVFSIPAARALCMAGEQGKALGVFKWYIEQNPFQERVIADAVACGGTEKNLGTELYGKPAEEVAQVLASRSYEELPQVYDKWAGHKKFRARVRTEAAAALYVQGHVDAEALVKSAQRSRYFCWQAPGDPSFAEETTAPTVLLEAADKLSSSKAGDDDARKHAVDILRVGAVMSGLARLEDHRGDWDVDARLEPCLATADYEFEPEAAIERMTRWVEASEKPRWEAHRLLALAYARTGDYDAAFEQAKLVLEHSRESHVSRITGNEMLIAFGHLSDRLDEIELLPNRSNDRYTALLEALRGGEEERRAVRVQPQREIGLGMTPPVGYFLRGAVAPGHEEQFLDDWIDHYANLTGYMWSRAEAARWRGDTEAEQAWKDRRAALHARHKDGENGGLRMLFVRL